MAICKRVFPLVVAALLASSPAAAQVSRIVVFGDSLSDPGNAFALLGATATPPDFTLDPFLVPSAPYARGGQHFSNGATWVEQLALGRGLGDSVHPAFRGSSPTASNFAVGAARLRADGRNIGLGAQVQLFLARSGGVAPSDAQYVIALGGNDVRDALVAYSQGQNGALVIQAALESLAANVGALYAAGARRFLIWNAPDIGRTPALRMAGPAVADFGTLLSLTFNASQAAVLAQLGAALPGAVLTGFDAFGLIGTISAQPAAYELTNVTDACVDPGMAPFTCERPDEFLFWDGIHPTRAVHAIIAREVSVLLAGVLPDVRQ